MLSKFGDENDGLGASEQVIFDAFEGAVDGSPKVVEGRVRALREVVVLDPAEVRLDGVELWTVGRQAEEGDALRRQVRLGRLNHAADVDGAVVEHDTERQASARASADEGEQIRGGQGARGVIPGEGRVRPIRDQRRQRVEATASWGLVGDELGAAGQRPAGVDGLARAEATLVEVRQDQLAGRSAFFLVSNSAAAAATRAGSAL